MILPRAPMVQGTSNFPILFLGIIFPQVLALFILLARIISRVFLLHLWAWDDTLIVLAWIFTVAITVLFGLGTEFGQGYHIQDVSLSRLEQSFIFSYAALICYQLSLWFTKLSILAFYLRAFPSSQQRLITWITIGVSALFGVPLITALSFECNPLTGKSFLGLKITCFPPIPFLICSTILHTIIDTWIIIMVVPIVLKLDIRKRQKAGLIAVLSLGLFVIIASILRVVSILAGDPERDITFALRAFDIWTVLECVIGLICACLPTTRPLLRKCFPDKVTEIMVGKKKSKQVGLETPGEIPMSFTFAPDVAEQYVQRGPRDSDWREIGWTASSWKEEPKVNDPTWTMNRVEEPIYEMDASEQKNLRESGFYSMEAVVDYGYDYDGKMLDEWTGELRMVYLEENEMSLPRQPRQFASSRPPMEQTTWV